MRCTGQCVYVCVSVCVCLRTLTPRLTRVYNSSKLLSNFFRFPPFFSLHIISLRTKTRFAPRNLVGFVPGGSSCKDNRVEDILPTFKGGKIVVTLKAISLFLN
ncbi:hypothetical protein, unlikely [Trypanosoma brucei gambiense DAL972]|uniref:Uncharacterized protein n=1 Tax=Trypanosoma brucei gambiense (strain MHOM/CI/86/DAL972) TaxID=679716 RepID=C9ZK75_TRYB9|nr:hypothetical protein, unlikely [Trypanosoma brucei gambiense DAL972]CBH09839.1 hypothetical protein, unlikely [Trypanosoma brucei gambiense DAL972]|eukprot:XP_011772132.1 hypothetical protein, unlikely [Trypanosoma brucei gambiense DAL972]